MNLQDISHSRLINQHITTPTFTTPAEVVGWMGAMQAQDYTMSKWAIGCRLTDATEVSIDTAIIKGDIIRTHLLRPTWHWVAAKDINWLLALTAPQIRALMKSNNKALELTPAIFRKSNKIITEALTGHNHLSRETLKGLLAKANIPLDNNRAAHLFAWAELEGLICSGIPDGKQQTYALLEERIKMTNSISREEALKRLAEIYFKSRGPATLKDFIWWSGLSIMDAKHALETTRGSFIEIVTKEGTYWLREPIAVKEKIKTSCYLLPSFDELLIGYKNRTASIPLDVQSKAFTNNGIFRPIVVINGKVKGIWSRSLDKDKATVSIDFLEPPSGVNLTALKRSAKVYGKFLEKEVIIAL